MIELFLCFVCLIEVNNCERLKPKGTSYGYVPDDVKISKYKGDDHEQWMPVNARNSANATTDNPSNKSLNFENNSRSLKLKGPYYYEPPHQYVPPFSDDAQPDDINLPPASEDDFFKPSNDVPQEPPGYVYDKPEPPFDDLRPPLDDEVPIIPSNQYLPSSIDAKNIVFKTNKDVMPLHIEVNEMHCYDTPTDGRFRATLTFRSKNENVPVFEDGIYPADGCEVKSDAIPPRLNTRFSVNISKKDFQQCGVKSCSTNGGSELLCVRLRFPTVTKMRLPEDAVLTLQCRSRDRVAAQTKHIHFDVANSAAPRSNGVIARGGSRGVIRSRTQLYRRGLRGEYTEALPLNARVAFGDTIMLKADIEPTDGWVSSRLSTISLRSGSDTNEEVVLLRADGCRLPQTTILCPKDPVSISPLGHTLLIRAPLFEGMRSGEEMRLSVRLVACLEADDCRPSSCSSSSTSTSRGNRSKRQAFEDHIANSTSELSFKVVMPYSYENEPSEKGTIPSPYGMVIAAITVLSMVIICSTLLIFLKTETCSASLHSL